MVIVIKSKLYRRNPIEINLVDISASRLLSHKNNGDFVIRCAGIDYNIYKEPLCYLSPLMKRFVCQYPKKHLRVHSRNSPLLCLFRTFVYRKYCVIRFDEIPIFARLLKSLRIDFDILYTYEIV